ncbi:glycosyltransferase family protein [Phormidesmis sp. 146-33]
MKLLVYSHDAFGLGNIRRMLAICEYLLQTIPNLSILLLSGSPMMQGFRISNNLDYIKLPCLNRGTTGKIATKFLGMDADETVKLRSKLIRSAAASFKPDMVLVDKKPYGIQNELMPTLTYLKTVQPETKMVLLLRDILDSPEVTIAEWQKHGFEQTVEEFYDRLLIVGTPEIFDFCHAYQLPSHIAYKARYCGYLRRPQGCKSEAEVRQELALADSDRLVVVTPGGGEDGYPMVDAFLQGVSTSTFKSLVICGPEMPIQQRQALYQTAAHLPQVEMREFSDDLMSYLGAADIVVSMGGYNTICEVLTAGKRAVIVPRVKPSQEQIIRTNCMARFGFFSAIEPSQLSPQTLFQAVQWQMDQVNHPLPQIDLNGLSRIAHHLSSLMKVDPRDSAKQNPYAIR